MSLITEQLNDALASRDPDMVEIAVAKAHGEGLQPDQVTPLIALLNHDWHTRHEDIVLALQKLIPPEAVESLAQTATKEFPYLNYDEGFALARKCTWALADIGTPEAKQALINLSQNSNSVIAAYAEERLKNWDTEQHRKHHKN